MEKTAWLVLTVVTLIEAIAAQQRPRALTIGRVALGIYYVFAGALIHLLYLVRGETYATFADAAQLSFVRDTWRAVVAPHYLVSSGCWCSSRPRWVCLFSAGVAGRSLA
jgi:hypothetical protein